LELDARMRSEQQRMEDILRYIQSATGVAPPRSLFTPNPPPSDFSTPVSMTVLVCMFMLKVKCNTPNSSIKNNLVYTTNF
jgi:hypothetical protein